jgi:hypothetical protein
MIKFSEWLQAKESSAFTRTRRAAILGLGPSIPDASLHSHSTALFWQVPKGKKKKKKKSEGTDSMVGGLRVR